MLTAEVALLDASPGGMLASRWLREDEFWGIRMLFVFVAARVQHLAGIC